METRNPTIKLSCQCSICRIARSKGIQSKSINDSILNKDEELPDKCPKCLSPLGVGHSHSTGSCNSTATLLDNLETQLPPHVSEQFACRVIERAEKNSEGQSVLHNGRWPKLVSTGPVPEPVQIPHSAFFKMEREVGLSRNSINSVKTILTTETKNRKLVEPYLKEAMVEQGRICDEYFHVNDMKLFGKDNCRITTPVVLLRMFQTSLGL